MKVFFVSLACIFASGLAHASENWPRFRGPNGGGNAESSIPAVWEKSSYRWQLPLKENGHGSPAVWGNRVFLNSSADKGQTRKVLCVDAKTGKVNWTRSYPSKTHKTHRYNSFASSTPALDGKNVYSVWGHSSELKVCAHTHEGKLLWEKDLGGVKGGHGFAVSPIVFEDLLIVPNDQEKGGGAHYGLDCSTGEIRWKVPRGSKRLTYSTPCVFTDPKGKPELIFTNWWLGFTSLEPRTGKQLWELSVFGRPHSERAISSPIVAGDLVLGVCGFTTLDKHLVAIRPASVSEDGKAREIWRLENTMPHIPSPLLSDNRLYLWADNGVITCVRPKTGKQVWKTRVEGVKDTFFGSPVRAGNTIFCVSAFGQVVAIADGDEFKQLGVTDLKQVCRSTPALANGDLYLRTGDQLICIKGE
ncbi:MAG: PQQ-binding-like beta-propeller repeat protein [Opitutae bacterium]|nr:PQQ-binding-like beta-propeller repeat protein [Opitutae bacterium]